MRQGKLTGICGGLPTTPRRQETCASVHTPIDPNILTLGSKRKREEHNYKSLDSHGLTDTPLLSKMSRKTASKTAPQPSKKSKSKPSKTSTEPVLLQSTDDDSNTSEEEKKKPGKYAWFWKYFKVEELLDQWERGRGKNKKWVQNECYIYIFNSSCQYSFVRYAKALHGSTSGLSEYIELKHHTTKETEA